MPNLTLSSRISRAPLLYVILIVASARAQLPVVFGPSTSTTFTATTCRGGLLPVDLDQDGDQDFVTLGAPGVPFITTVINQSGTFVQGPYLPVAANPARIDLGDIDQDGDSDFLSDSGAVVSILINTGNSVVRTDYASVGRTDGAQFADLDGDGNLDIVVGVDHVRKGSGNGAFGPMQSLGITSPIPSGSQPIPERRVLIADLDQDGDADIARVGAVIGQGGIVEVYLQNAGAFVAALSDAIPDMTSAIGASGIVKGDFDRDGSPDFAVVDAEGPCSIRTYRRQGSAFERHRKIPLSVAGHEIVGTFGLAVADLDSDGDDDIATFLNTSFSISPFQVIFLSTVFVAHGSASGLVLGQSGVVTVPGTFHDPKLVELTGGPGFDLVGATSPSLFGTAPGTMHVRPNLLSQGTSVPTYVLEIASGDWSVMRGTPIATDLEIRAIDGASGQPVSGLTVTTTPSTFAVQSGVAYGAASTVTNAAGIATFSPSGQSITAQSGNEMFVTASNGGAAPVEVRYFVNGLADAYFPVWGVGQSLYQLIFAYDRGGLPIIVAAETPPPSPIPTTFGTIATSILSPGPGLFILDGLGAFAPPNPSVVTTSTFAGGPGQWFTQVNFPAGSLAGQTFVFQVYGYDPLRPPALAPIVSNPLTRSF